MLMRTIQHDVTKSRYIRLLAFSFDDQRKAEIAEWYGLIGWLKVVKGESEQSKVPALGYIMLYGSHEHEGSMMELKPGEWIRVRTTMKLHTWPIEPILAR